MILIILCKKTSAFIVLPRTAVPPVWRKAVLRVHCLRCGYRRVKVIADGSDLSNVTRWPFGGWRFGASTQPPPVRGKGSKVSLTWPKQSKATEVFKAHLHGETHLTINLTIDRKRLDLSV